MAVVGKGPTLYDFLLEAELSHYFSPLKNDLKVTSVAQLKYVEEDDLLQMGMTKPEMRRLRKYFQKYCPQTYLRKIKKMILKNKDDPDRSSIYFNDNTLEKNNIKVPSKHIIPKDNIVINKELGVGEFGVVQQGVWTNEEGERIQVAIKCLSEERMQKNHMEFLKEAAIMHTIDHENIVRLYGVVLETNTLMLVTELAPLRSLLECLKEPALRPSFPVISLCDFAQQICEGMQYLESKKLIHRDLAARNILVFAKNKVKISDFGLSRALGVGKDYYQTNFNVNLKLPIAWCAPECINYLRFTSASDVWAYGVTLWEMFSYGFQPWPALTGQQILEAIDEPNFQRLEQPECCPKEYYTLMLKCWQHDANKRPKFSEINTMLPEYKPEQVQAIQDSIEIVQGPKSKKDWLPYKTGDVITVLDKRPLPDTLNVWKGILNNGKTGLFNPAHTVAYVRNFPTSRPSFSRADSRSGLYASRRRLRTDMISRPQGDFKHTGHVGLDGAFFGDVAFLGDKYQQLPRQIVTPYKPQDDKENVSPTLTTLSSDSSDKIPLLKKFSTSDGRSGSSSDNWSEVINDQIDSPIIPNSAVDGSSKRSSKDDEKLMNLQDHEYHEISDEEDFGNFIENSKFESLDLGPSLMDEVFKALGSPTPELISEEQNCNENNLIMNEIKEISKLGRDNSKKKHAIVKPISAADEQTLDSAIAIAKELASKSLLNLEHKSDNDTPLESPKTPTSPFKRKFSFKFKTSPKPERRNFSEEAEAIPDIQDIITEEAKEAYNSLVEKGSALERSVSLPPAVAPKPILEVSHLRSRHQAAAPSQATDSSDAESETIDSNPLRMLRSGVPVRPKVRGNKHGIPNSTRASTPHTATVARLAANAGSSSPLVNGTRSSLGSPPPPPQAPKTFPRPNIASRYAKELNHQVGVKSDESPLDSRLEDQSDTSSTNTTVSCSESSCDASNPLPLPPRDRTKPLPVLKHHQRKHPLILPGSSISVLDTARNLTKQISCPDVPTDLLTIRPDTPERRASEGAPPQGCISIAESASSNSSSLTNCTLSTNANSSVPPPKPARTYTLDDSFENEIQAELDNLDNMPEKTSQLLYKGGDHVSCEDLLEFALDKPGARRTQGRSRGIDSDEVRIMLKVLSRQQMVTREECLSALNETDWDVHTAIKYLQLQCILNSHMIPTHNVKQTLAKCNWDVRQAANYLLATHNVNEDTTEV
ncbi:activated Cdc42 kinase-like isoform X1 [Argiope bruennichi]|uniref:activated Cdc42 kinase-like isoform X1 n=1 Tax=Argiope bruennichi TaxID=94029 RepID=UPI002494596F|nr:activated Cdc42 kinase-like isoform X1 [Argiope bruennichi]XP_055938738.1 activated Cdc42 kinase-like isoform X1 [Argiope bruennichi]